MGVLGALGPDEYAHPDFGGVYDISYSDYTPNISMDSYTEYGTESRMDEAVAVLQDAGYERNSNDIWEDESGNVVGPNILSSDIADFFLNQSLEWVNSLQNLGFDTEIDSLPYDQFFDRLGATDYDMTIVAWMPSAPFGYNLQSATFLTTPRRDTDPTGWVAEDPIQTQVPEYGNPDGSMMDVNVSEKLSQAQFASDDETYNQSISELCWIANESLPTIFCGEILDTIVADNANFQWPEVGSAEWPSEWWIGAVGRGVPLPRE
jgi:ABC-type oligopeptide transport system substrate-binding subunit